MNEIFEVPGGRAWISYNPMPSISGVEGAETALCIRQRDGSTKYYILLGDHRKKYKGRTFTQCRAVFNKLRVKHEGSWSCGERA